jgi:hypothetical protein
MVPLSRDLFFAATPKPNPGYKERVDFGRVIGEYALKIEGKPTSFYPTTKGIIHYAADGKVHVVPADPGGLIK